MGGCRLLSGWFSSFLTGNAGKGQMSVQIWRSVGSERWHLGEWEFFSFYWILLGVLQIETDQSREGGRVWWMNAFLHQWTGPPPEDRSSLQEWSEIEEGRLDAGRHGEGERRLDE